MRPVEEVSIGITEPGRPLMISASLVSSKRTKVGPAAPQTARPTVKPSSSRSSPSVGEATCTTLSRRSAARPSRTASGPSR